MMELAYDIASGANFKFNTGFHGIQVRFAHLRIKHVLLRNPVNLRCSELWASVPA